MNPSTATSLYRRATDAGLGRSAEDASTSPRADVWAAPLPHRSAVAGLPGADIPRAAVRITRPLRSDPQRIWDGAGHCFNPGALREAMLVRGLSADELAASAEVARATLYDALKGRPTRLQTARRLLEVPAGVEPTLRLRSLTED